jgi:beta-galactosidase GanA
MVYGERIMVFSGEFHPYRLPVPDLWLDVFQKIKALGFNAVSFYVHWALLEGKPGHYSAEGVFAFEPFFAAAKEAGIYLIARPGPVSKKPAMHRLMLILCSISMRNPVEEASLDGFKGSRGNSERGLLTI